MNTILVGCKLPSGIVLDGSAGQAVTLNGANTSLTDSGVGLTHVDATEWLYLQNAYAQHSAFLANTVFHFKASSSVADVMAVAEDLEGEKTGFEGLDPNAPAPGLKPEDPAKLKQELNKNAGPKPPKNAKNLSKADKAAALEAAQGAN